MSHAPLSGVQNSSPYLRRYRLPIINSNSSMATYDELLSPVDNCSKMALISNLNFQNKKFCLNKPVPRPTTLPLNAIIDQRVRPEVTQTICIEDECKMLRIPSRTTTDFQFRFVAAELDKKCAEYDQIQ